MIIDQTFTAGVGVPFLDVGTFLRVLASDVQDKLSISFYKDGSSIADVQGVGAGYAEWFDAGETFDKIVITSSVTQAVRVVTRLRNRVTYDTPPVGNVAVLSLPPVTIANPDAQKKYFTYGSSFKSNTPLVANTPETIFTAAANVNGAILHRCGISQRTGGLTVGVAFIAKATAPASMIDGDVVVQMDNGAAISGYFWGFAKLSSPVLIPPGKGLFVMSSDTENFGNRSALYTLL